MKAGQIRGIEIKLKFSTILVVLLVAFYAGTLYIDLVPDISLIEVVLVGLANGVILLGSILLHEIAHSIYAQKDGLEVSEIELHIFGGVSKIKEEPRTPKSELIISGVGPLTSLILGFGSLGFLFLYPFALPSFVSFTLFYSGLSNALLGAFNMIPAFPMDGGRVLRSILWQKRKDLISATKTASKVGTFFGYGFIAFGVVQMILLGALNGIWLLFIGTFVISSAKNALTQTLYQIQLSAINAKDLIRVPKVFIPFDMTIEEAIHRYFMVYRYPYFPVIEGGLIVGIVHMDDIKTIPVDVRHRYIIGYVMRKISDFPQIHGEESGKQVLDILNEMGDQPHIVIVEDEQKRLAGFIGTEDLVSALKYADLMSKQKMPS